MRGSDVKAVQSSLVAHGLGAVVGPVDGIFGPKTSKAVRAFQTAAGIKVDGIVGPITRAALAAPAFAGTEHFKKEEFRCRCGGKTCNGYLPAVPTGVTMPLYTLLEAIRAEVTRLYGGGKDAKIIVRSGYRDKSYNRAVGGATSSQHISAKAADIYSPQCNMYQLGVICDRLNPNGGVGLGSTVNVHVDVRGKRSRWWYTYKSWAAWKSWADRLK